MKCLEKDRNRRYETANGLVLDIERRLSNEPVMARRPPSTWYCVQKFAKRNKLAFASAAIVSMALLMGITASLGGLLEAKRQRGIARAERDEAREARKVADRQVYFMHLANAGRALQGKDYLEKKYPRARIELDACTKELRGWEWP